HRRGSSLGRRPPAGAVCSQPRRLHGRPSEPTTTVGTVYEGIVQDLIDELGKLPGIGPKSAQRIAFHLLDADDASVRQLADVLIKVKDTVRFCDICGNVSADERCRVCADTRRSDEVICVVEESKDIVAIERIREFKGRYHVLGGAIDPIGGVGPDDLRITQLMSRLGTGETHEVILALDPNIEGEATAAYLSRLLGPLELTVTRLASGLPVGGVLDYAYEMTLRRALLGRRTMRGRRHVDDPCPRPAAGAADEPAPTAAAPARGPLTGAAGRDHRRIPSHDHPGTAADRLGPGADP